MVLYVTGVMEISFLKALINNISEFSRLSSSNNIKSEPIQSYHQKIDEALKLLRLILDEIVDSEISSDEGFNEALKELNAVVNEARDLIEGWQQMTSKLYFVSGFEYATIASYFYLHVCSNVVYFHLKKT